MSTGELLFGIHSIEAALTHDAKNITELYFEADSQNARIIGHRSVSAQP